LIRYIDTSVLVSAFTKEAATERCQFWLTSCDPETLAISDWVTTEFCAALSVKLRTGAVDVKERAEALAAFEAMAARSVRVLPVERSHFRAAAALANQYWLGLRAGDALHLALALAYGANLHTLDRGLAEAAGALGVRFELL
jgi:predicted nucleic acid-binding protein